MKGKGKERERGGGVIYVIPWSTPVADILLLLPSSSFQFESLRKTDPLPKNLTVFIPIFDSKVQFERRNYIMFLYFSLSLNV